ncbi:MAG TPA: 50S ribosomal protein L19 [Spirochaetota bacterium]|nr:50S ribosomal protein L19 [Spirochaetota bacterium]
METIQKEIMPPERPLNFEVGDTVKVHYKIVEGNRERIQVFEGVVIAINNKGVGKSFTVRRISYDVGVERVFPLYSARIAKIESIRKGKTRRAKLYFLRERTGKSAKLKEKRVARGKARAPFVEVPATTEVAPEAREPEND